MASLRSWWNQNGVRVVRNRTLPKAELNCFLWQLASSGFAPQHIVDIGANQAKWSRKAHRVYPNAHFTLIEPQREMRPYLDGFRRQSPTAQVLCAGVGDTVGTMKLTLIPDTVSSGFLHNDEVVAQQQWDQRDVPVLTLDHLVEHHLHCIPDLVKIDAEGMEGRIMQAAEKLIGQTELFLLEAPLIDPPPGWNSFSEIVAMMSDLGYEVYEFTHMMRQHNHPATSLVEVAFARREGILRCGMRAGSPANAA